MVEEVFIIDMRESIEEASGRKMQDRDRKRDRPNTDSRLNWLRAERQGD